jgi:cysteine desulfurase/selenocysteine lyase
MSFTDIELKKIRGDFPGLTQKVRGKNYVYLDSAATSLKPWPVIESLSHFNSYEVSNIHRGAHYYADKATTAYEETRLKIKSFLNVDFSFEVIFTKGTTESINIVTQSFAKNYLKEKDVVVLSQMEHHANIVPWLELKKSIKFEIKYIPITNEGMLDIEAAKSLLKDSNVKILSITHVSNVLGTINPVSSLCEYAKRLNIITVIDGAQAVGHLPVDLKEINCDFYAFSAHKVYGPFGVGCLIANKDLLQRMSVYQAGGSMISDVGFQEYTPNEVPFRFEAGTPNIDGVIAFGKAIDYLVQLQMSKVASYKSLLTEKFLKHASDDKDIVVYGPKEISKRISVFSFQVKGIHSSDLNSVIDQESIATRSGHLCAQPLMKTLKVTGLTRASFSFYNTEKEIENLFTALAKAKGLFL